MLKDLVYRLYERQLDSEVRRGAIPEHVGVILDGNRRFARKAGLGSLMDGHRRGADNAERLVSWCDDLRIPVVTLWALSTDNFRRPSEELAAIFDLVEEKVDRFAELQERSRFPRRIRAVGRRDLLPDSTRAAIEQIEAATAANAAGELIVAVGYGGREEITDAVRRLIADRLHNGDSLEGVASGLNPDEIAQYLYAPDVRDPDLNWPEFRRIDFLRAIRSYAQRQRRHGE
jgi:short-chain Z-isoprenyl diphosphate synthase